MENWSVVCEYTAAACLLAQILKFNRVVAINVTISGTSVMSLESQKRLMWSEKERYTSK